jgi:hypothetical protein
MPLDPLVHAGLPDDDQQVESRRERSLCWASLRVLAYLPKQP